jgi:hypothetical protein
MPDQMPRRGCPAELTDLRFQLRDTILTAVAQARSNGRPDGTRGMTFRNRYDSNLFAPTGTS